MADRQYICTLSGMSCRWKRRQI